MWICKNCGEKDEDVFDSCWKCGRERGPDFPPLKNDTEPNSSEQISFDEHLKDLNWPACRPVCWIGRYGLSNWTMGATHCPRFRKWWIGNCFVLSWKWCETKNANPMRVENPLIPC
jgi:hypothetical protein